MFSITSLQLIKYMPIAHKGCWLSAGEREILFTALLVIDRSNIYIREDASNKINCSPVFRRRKGDLAID